MTNVKIVKFLEKRLERLKEIEKNVGAWENEMEHFYDGAIEEVRYILEMITGKEYQ